MTKPILCECGSPKLTPGATACERCAHLDGIEHGTSRPADVITALRDNGNSTLTELIAHVYGKETADGRRALMRTVQRMLTAKRIRRYERELDTTPIRAVEFGPAARFKNAGRMAWVYALDGRTDSGR